MDYLLNNSKFFENIVESIIRPPKQDYYSTESLGPEYRFFGNIKVQRVALAIQNSKNQLLQCSLYLPRVNENDIQMCCVYLHGNAGSQLEGIIYLQELVQYNIALFTIDLTGSGKSQGKYITLGLQEQHDLTAALKFLDEIFQFHEYIIWGRSMGAVTALLHEANQQLHSTISKKISILILDSPFMSFKKLCTDLGKAKFKLPEMIQELTFKTLKNKIEEKTGYNLFSIDLENSVMEIKTPAFYVYSEQDQLISSQHSKKLCQNHGLKYRNRRVQHYVFKGQHNDFRGEGCVRAIMEFIRRSSRCKFDRVDLQLPKKELQIPKIVRSDKEVKTQPNDINRKLSVYEQGISRSWNLLSEITSGRRHQQTISNSNIKSEKEYRQLSAGPRENMQQQQYFIAQSKQQPNVKKQTCPSPQNYTVRYQQPQKNSHSNYQTESNVVNNNYFQQSQSGKNIKIIQKPSFLKHKYI